LLPVLRAMVRDGKTETGGRALGFLVVEPDRFAAALDLFPATAGFSLYLRLRVHLDPVHPQPGHPSSAQKSAPRLSGLWKNVRAEIQLLLRVRHTADDGGDAGGRGGPITFSARAGRAGRRSLRW